MERDNRYYSENYRDEHNRNKAGYRNNDEEQFENYRNRYSDRGNYYGMRNEDAEYENVRSTGSNRSGARGNYGDSSSRSNQDSYHYGDPNPYMNNERNGGYDRTRGTGWRDNNDRYSHYESNRISDRDRSGSDRYSRQDNSYEYGEQGSGKRYSDFGRDEGRTYNPNRNRGYNMETEDSYYDRSSFNRSSSDNNYRGSGSDRRMYNEWEESDRNRDDDFRYSGRVKRSGSDDDNYATGRYASNRSYRSEHPSNSDGERSSSRQNRSGFSGPDYGSRSSISDYGSGEYRG